MGQAVSGMEGSFDIVKQRQVERVQRLFVRHQGELRGFTMSKEPSMPETACPTETLATGTQVWAFWTAAACCRFPSNSLLLDN